MSRIVPAPIIGQSAASGAQVIDGSLNFEGGKNQALKRTPTTAGNRRTWTWSCWLKKQNDNRSAFFSAGTTSSDTGFSEFGLGTQKRLRFSGWNTNWKTGSEKLRDYNNFYHFVVAVDYTNSTASNKVRLYKNGVEVTDLNNNNTPSDTDRAINATVIHYIGGIDGGGGENLSFTDYRMSQVYFIDGQQLGPEYFGFTDPLTNTWRPKKYTGTFAIASGTPSVSNGGLVIKADGASINGTFVVNGGVKTWTSPDGVTWTRNGDGRSSAAAKYLAVGGAGTALRTFYPDAGSGGFTFYMYNGGGEFDGSSSPFTLDLSSQTYLPSQTSSFGGNGFYLPFDGNSPIGQDQSGNGNNWTPVNFGGSVALDNPIVSGARPILNTTQGGSQAGVGVFGSLESKFYTVTTANGSVYQFDITSGDNPSLEFIRGATYRFDYTSHASHPLRFSSTNPDSSTTAYTTGTNTSVSNVITITVPHDAPDTLYYYCTAHASAMNGAISVTTDNTKADQYAANCVLALPLVGSTGDVSASIACTSTTKVMSSGNATASSAQSNHYNGSFNLSGTSSYINTPAGSDFAYGTGDFTVEAWIWSTSGSGNNTIYTQVVSGTNYFVIVYNGSGDTVSFLTSGGNFTTTNSLARERWNHVAVVRKSGTASIYLNGKKDASASNTYNFSNTSYNPTVGTYTHSTNTENLNGYIQDFRIYKGAAKYDGDFVVPSRSPDILPDTPSGVSGVSKLTKITDGAVAFDGSSDSLKVSDSSDLAFGTGEFTVEMFFYANTVSGNDVLYDSRAATGNPTDGFSIVRNGDQLRTYTSGAYQITPSTFRVGTKRWYHLAITRESTTQKMYIDGVLVGSATVSNDFSQPKATIGSDVNKSESWDGFISNFRLIKGTALYTSNFTPPTEPLTNVTNTKLLCCQSNKSSAIAAVSPNISGSINDGTAWSSIVTGPTRKEDRVANAFNGSTSGPGAIPAYPGTLTFAPGFTGLTTVKIYGYYAGSGVTLYVNGSQQSPSSGAFTLTISTSTLDSVVWAATDGFNYMRIDAIEIDSTVLIDPVIGPDDSNEAATNFNPFNTDINTVRGQETGYCTLNPLDTIVSLTNGNLETSNSSGWQSTRANIGMTSGKFYWETQNNQDAAAILGISNERAPMTGGLIFGSDANPAWAWAGANYYFDSSTAGTGLSNHGTSDIVQYALDVDSGKLWFGRNGVWYDSSWGTGGNPAIGANPTVSGLDTDKTYFACASFFNGSAKFNFGQKPFKFPPPDGFQPINGTNILPETVIPRPDQYMGTTLYTGSGETVSPRTIELPQDADLVWAKSRDRASSHQIADTVRGNNSVIRSNTTHAAANPTTEFNGGGVSIIDGKTISLVKGSTNQANNENLNATGQKGVVWSWKAGGSKGTFNVDDVGYANASDVNMNAGALNSSAYNQSSVWTNDLTGTPYPGQTLSRLFDGTTSTGLIPNNGTSITFSPTGFSSISKLRIYGYSYTGNANGIRVNGNDYTSLFTTGGGYSSSSKWVTIPETHLSSVEWSINSNGLENGHLGGIEVDGKLLVDSGVTPTNVPSVANTGCSVGTKQGFSITKFTTGSGTSGGATIAHGLNSKPDMYMYKPISTSGEWVVVHNANYNRFAYLNDTVNFRTIGSQGGGTAADPTDNVLTLYDLGVTLASKEYICYAWSNIPGVQKFGRYEGTGVAGNYVNLGFRPALLWIKSFDTTSIQNWGIIDSTRSYANPGNHTLATNLSSAESYFGGGESVYGSSNKIDLLSDGFALREASGFGNTSGITFIYCAWAEAPQFNLYGGQSNAR